MTTHLRRLDVIIARLVTVRSTIQTNFAIEFDIDHLLPIIEVSVNALVQDIDQELKESP